MQIMNSSKCLWTAATMLLFGRHCQGLAMLHPMSGKTQCREPFWVRLQVDKCLMKLRRRLEKAINMARRSYKKERFIPFLLLGPALLMMLLIVAYPLFQALKLSLFDASLLRPDRAKFIGLANYIQIVRNPPIFIRSLVNSLIWIVGSVTLQFIVGGCWGGRLF